MFKLAGHLGMTVRALCEELSEEELVEWLAYDRLDPIGAYRQDLQTALLALMQSGTADSELSDFLLIDPDPVTEEEAERRERVKQAEARKAHAERMKAQIAKMIAKQEKKQALPSD